jgi:hypothetical protein
LQAIKFKSAQVLPETSVKVGDAALRHGEDYVILPPYASEQVDATGGVVFAGYGVVSPELKRDDLAGLELKGKVAIILSGQPDGVDAAAWKRATNPQVRGMNLFGRGRGCDDCRQYRHLRPTVFHHCQLSFAPPC